VRVGVLTWRSLPGEARSCSLRPGAWVGTPIGSEFEVAPASPGFARRSDCTSVALAPRAAGVRVWQIPSGGRRPPGRRRSVLPQRANVAYAPLRLLSAGSNSLPLRVGERLPCHGITLPARLPQSQVLKMTSRVFVSTRGMSSWRVS